MTNLTEKQLANLTEVVSYLYYDHEEVKSFVGKHWQVLSVEDVEVLWQNRNNSDSIFTDAIVKPLLELNESLGGESAVKCLQYFI